MTELPGWMPESLWKEFIKHRQRIRSPMTDYAGSLILCKLERFRAEGANPIDVLNESIERGWAGVFLNGHGRTKEEQEFCEKRIAVHSVRAAKGEIPCAQISILADIELNQIKAMKHAQMNRIRCKGCGCENWISMSGGKCQSCRK